MKSTRTPALLPRTLGIALLSGCAAFAANGAPNVASTLQTTSPLSSVSSAYGATSLRYSNQAVTPAKTVYTSRVEALAACQDFAVKSGGIIITTSGTPSMEPLIHGKTFVVVQKRPFETIATKDILVYMGRPDSSKPNRIQMLHRAVDHDRYGWIMSGDNNRWTESWDRVTPETYVGVVVALFEYPQA